METLTEKHLGSQDVGKQAMAANIEFEISQDQANIQTIIKVW